MATIYSALSVYVCIFYLNGWLNLSFYCKSYFESSLLLLNSIVSKMETDCIFIIQSLIIYICKLKYWYIMVKSRKSFIYSIHIHGLRLQKYIISIKDDISNLCLPHLFIRWIINISTNIFICLKNIDIFF